MVSSATSTSTPPPVSLPPVSSIPSSIPSIVAHNSIPSIVAQNDDKQKVILSSKLPNHVTLQQQNSQPPSSVVSLIKRSEPSNIINNSVQKTIQVSSGQPATQYILANGTSAKGQTTAVLTQNGQTIHIPELILPQGAINGDGTNGHYGLIEVIQVAGSANGGTAEIINGSNQVVIENEEVMWGAGSTLGPAVIVETNEALPVTYIEGEGGLIYSAASLDNIDYDYLYPATTSGTSSVVSTVRSSAANERQLEFSTF